MQESTVSVLEDYYSHVFAIDIGDVWSRVTVRRHGERLQDFAGYYVASRGGVTHVSVPPSTGPELLEVLESQPAEVIQESRFWQQFAETHALRVIGPSTHAYLDADPGPDPCVVAVDEKELSLLKSQVDAADWAESGWDDQPTRTFGLYDSGVLVAASNLNTFHHQPRDVGVLVAPAHRGRGLSEKVGRHAASIAIREHGFARWGARNTNVASLAASRNLRFVPWCSQLAVR